MKKAMRTLLVMVTMLAGSTLFSGTLAAQTYVYINDDALYDAVLPNSNTVSAYSVGAGGVLTPVPGSPFSTGVGHFGCFGGSYASNRLAIAGSFLYASNCYSHSISGFSIDSGTGALTLVGTPFSLTPQPSLDHRGLSLAATPNGQFLIAGAHSDILSQTVLHVLSIGATGELTEIPGSPFPMACFNIAGITVSPNGNFLVVPCGLNAEIHVFNIGAAGDLSPVAGSPFSTLPYFSFTADINSENNLLFAGVGGGVAVFNMAADGSLTPIPGSPFPLDGTSTIGTVLVSPDDQFLYVSRPNSRTVSAFAVAANGTLTPLAGSPFPAEPSDPSSFDGPAGLAVDSSGAYLFAAGGIATYPSGVYSYSILGGGALGPSSLYLSTNTDEAIPLSIAVYSVETENGDEVGPITSNVVANPNPVAINTPSVLTALVDDTTTGGSTIASAAYTVDGGSPISMNAADGAFDAVMEGVTATIAPFATTGVRSLCVRGTDQPGNVGAPACIYLPVYDPNGSFVTGGGAVESPAGADLANESATGPATFGFVSKYKPGKSTPDGNLEFHFKAGNINFKSTSMDWLVVTGEPRAQFQGTGTINGTTECKFAVDAWDLSHIPGYADAFGLKIFACSGGGERYNLPATSLSKGSIIIHKQ